MKKKTFKSARLQGETPKSERSTRKWQQWFFFFFFSISCYPWLIVHPLLASFGLLLGWTDRTCQRRKKSRQLPHGQQYDKDDPACAVCSLCSDEEASWGWAAAECSVKIGLDWIQIDRSQERNILWECSSSKNVPYCAILQRGGGGGSSKVTTSMVRCSSDVKNFVFGFCFTLGKGPPV